MTTVERLLTRLREMGADLPPCIELRRTYRKSCTVIGSWSWFTYCPHSARGREHSGHSDRYGSHWPVWVLLKAEKLVFTENSRFGQVCIDPVPERDSLELWGKAVRRGAAGAPLRLDSSQATD